MLSLNTRPLRILMTADSVGGVWRYAMDACAELRRQGAEVALACIGPAPSPGQHQEAARAHGKARFEQFVEQLGRHLMRGRSLVRDVVEELHPDPMRMDDAAAVAEARERAS